MIASTSQHFEENRATTGLSFIQQTMKATGVSRRTIFRVRKELRETGTLASPQRSQRRPYKPVDDFDETVIRNKIHEFYTQRHQLPTLSNLLTVLRGEINYPGSRWHLHQTLLRLGFAWKKTVDNRRFLIEKPSVVEQRLRFYSKRKELEGQGYNFVYVDETWIDSAYTAKRCWQGENMPGALPPCNRGQRLIVVHAGSKNGFIRGAQLVYKAASATGDYHHEMNGQNFKKWLEEKLLPNLHSPSSIVVDNASYHSVQTDKCPTSSTKKAEIQVHRKK